MVASLLAMTQPNSNPAQPDHLSIVVEVVGLRTTADGGIRLTLDFGESQSKEAAWLIDAKNSGIALQAAFVKMTNDVIGLPPEEDEDGLPSADEIIDDIERKGQNDDSD